MNNTQSGARGKFDTLVISCPVCMSDDGDTLGVTGFMDRSLYSVVIMVCEDCSTVYLAPPPFRESGGLGNTDVLERVYARLIRRQMQLIPANSKFIASDAGGKAVLGRSPGSESFDIILLPLVLESVADPRNLLHHVGKLLSSDGRVDMILGNVDSSCFGVFGGRHWCGFRFPESRQHPGLQGLRHLASIAGFEVTHWRVSAAPNAWLLSARNWLRDWGASRLVVGLITGRWLVPWLLASLIEGISMLGRRGSVLVVSLKKG